MGVIGRNEPCHCGSGQKYKKCCLKLDEERLNNGATISELSPSFEIAKSKHDLAFGIKEMVLALIEQINIWLSRKNIQQYDVISNSQDLLNFANTTDMVELYLKINRKVLELNKRSFISLELKNLKERAKTLPSITVNERLILKTVAESNLGEFILLGDSQTADYSAMRIINEFAYQALKIGIPDNRYISKVTLYVDSDIYFKEKLVNWEFEYSSEKHNNIFVDWKPLDILNDEYHKIAHSLHGLEEQSKNDIATALFQAKAIPYKSRNKASYNGLITSLTSILERELKLLIELNEGKKVPELMFGKINNYLKDITLPYLENIPDLYNQLEILRKIRNKAAHGEEVTYDDFITVKEFTIDRQLFEFISWAKFYFEENEEVTNN